MGIHDSRRHPRRSWLRRAARVAPAVALLLAAGPAAGTIEVEGDDAFKTLVANTIAALKQNGQPQTGILQGLENSTNKIKIKKTNVPKGSTHTPDDAKKASDGTGCGATVTWEPTGTERYDDDVDRDPKAALFHELVHAAHSNAGTRQTGVDKDSGIRKEEITTCGIENQERMSKNKPKRTKYGGRPLP
jgi:hypothetical protein